MSDTQSGKLHFLLTKDDFQVDDREEMLESQLIEWKEMFEKSRFQALYELGFQARPNGFDMAGNFLYQLGSQFFRTLTSQSDLELSRGNVAVVPAEDEIERLKASVPFSLGAEYVSEQWIFHIFEKLQEIFAREIEQYDGTVAMYLAEKNQQLRVPERVFFHLVESREEDFPFAFLATYATKDASGRVRHVPLQYALTEYQNEREKLLELLSCLNRAAEESEIISQFVERGELFHPLRLTSEEAYQILKDIPKIEEAGILCRIPNWWKKRANGVSVDVKLGEEKPALLGFDSLMTMQPRLVVDGIPLTRDEIRNLLEQTNGLAYLKGRWIEVDHQRLELLLEEMEKYQGNISIMEMFRMGLERDSEEQEADVGPIITNGKWLAQLLGNLRSPKKNPVSSCSQKLLCCFETISENRLYVAELYE